MFGCLPSSPHYKYGEGECKEGGGSIPYTGLGKIEKDGGGVAGVGGGGAG